MKDFRQRRAFTIVEMVIVIAVIAVLAAVMIPTISGVIAKANVSADQQFAASLNVQLAMWEVDHGAIESESDLRDAINYYYGEGGTIDFYSGLTPKSGKQGYHYWYDAEEKQVVLATCDELARGRAAGDYIFAPESPRSLIIGDKNYFLMDQGGSDVIDTLNDLSKVDSNDAYADALDELAEIEDALAQPMAAKLAGTAISNQYGMFHNNAASVEFVYIAASKEAATTALGTSQVVGSLAGVKDIYLPAGVTVNMGALTGFYNADDVTPLLEETTELHVDTTKENLKNIFEAGSTDCVIVLPDGARYIVEGNKILALPDRNPVGEDLEVNSIESIDIQYSDSNPNVNQDHDYFSTTNSTLYLAYDLGSAQLSLANGLAASLVNWTVSAGAPIEIDTTGKITIVGDPDAQNVTATVTATLKADTSKTDTITVWVVFPKTVGWSLDTIGEKTADSTVANEPIKLSITDSEKLEFAIAATGTVGYTQGGHVKMVGAESTAFELGNGNLLELKNGNLVAHPENITEGNKTQTLTVTYKVGDKTYITATYEIELSDERECPIKVNSITDTVKMGEKYMFRVGNSDAFYLTALFNGTTDKKIKLEIFDANAITGNGTETPIATSGNFYAKIDDVATSSKEYTGEAWKNGKIQFSGTGVAIIRITANNRKAELTVEVVEGHNITSASQLKTNKNNVLLNDIDLKDYSADNITFSGNSTNHVVLYGNGFEFNIEAGRNKNFGIITLSNADIDNTRIIGAIYKTYGDAWNNGNTAYYASAVYVTANSRISNSYIFGCRANVRAINSNVDGVLEIVDTVLDCGRFANLDVTGYAVLDGVTTINEPRATNNDVGGLGIIIPEDGGSSTIEIIGKGIKQYNWVHKDDSSKLPNFFGKDILFTAMFGNNYTAFHHKLGNVTYVNMGILSLSASTTASNIKFESNVYTGKETSLGSYSGYVVSLNENYTLTENDLAYRTSNYNWNPSQQNASLPTFTWTSGYSDLKHEITFDSGSSAEFNPNVLTATKHKQSLVVNIALENDPTYTGGPVTFTEGGTYTFIYTVKDPYTFNADGTAADVKVYTFKLTVAVEVRETTISEPEFTFNGVKATIVEGTDGKYYVTLPAGTTDKTISAGGKTITYAKVNGFTQAVSGNNKYWYFPYYSGVVITNYKDAAGTAETFNSSTTSAGPVPQTFKDHANLFLGHDENNSVSNFADYGGYGMRRQTSNASQYQVARNTTVQFAFTAGNGTTYYYYVHYYFDTTDDAPASGGTCVAPDTLITLADGTQKRVDSLTGDELLLVWNMETGKLDSAPIMFVDSETGREYEVIKLHFSDGTEVKVIGEHGFWDYDLNKYVYLDNTAADYIGHWFAKQNGDKLEKVQLVDVVIETEMTEAWSPVTAGHLCYFVNGMLSMPGGVGGLFNIFDVDADTMTYDYEALARDIETYGLFTYEEMNAIVPLSEEMFNMAGGAYLKISIGKGNMTMEDLIYMIERYSIYFN